MKLGIADLPQEIIAHAHLACSSNQEIDIRHVVSVEMLLDGLLVDVPPIKLSRIHFLSDLTNRISNLSTAAVVEREREREAGVFGGHVERGLDFVENRFGEIFQPADLVELDVVL